MRSHLLSLRHVCICRGILYPVVTLHQAFTFKVGETVLVGAPEQAMCLAFGTGVLDANLGRSV